MRQYTAQRPRDTGEIQRLHEQGRVSNLPAAEGAHEPPELFLAGPPEPRGLLLEGAERSELTLRLDEPFHGPGTEGADELVLQVHDAHEETKSFHVVPSQVGTVPRPLEAAPEVAFLGGVAQAGQPEVEPLRAEPIQEAADVLRSTHRHDGDAFAVEGPTPPLCQRLERALVADPLDENDRSSGRHVGPLPANALGVDRRLCFSRRHHIEQRSVSEDWTWSPLKRAARTESAGLANGHRGLG